MAINNFWKFQSDLLTDFVGGNTLTNSGGVQLLRGGPLGTSADFTSDYLQPSNQAFGDYSSHQMWIMVAADANVYGAQCIDFRNGSDMRSIQTSQYPSSATERRYNMSNGAANAKTPNPSFELNTGKFDFVVGTCNHVTGKMSIFLNGKFIEESSVTINNFTSATCKIGAEHNLGANRYLNGKLSMCCIKNHIVSYAEVKNEYSLHKGFF